jgi:formylglycine-generating enzyme required for sulfatase activity
VVSVADVPVSSSADAQPDARLKHMVRIPGGTFRMGSDTHYAEKAPARAIAADRFPDTQYVGS